MSEMTRRALLLSLPAVARRAVAQAGSPAIPVKALNHFTLAVSDVKRSLDCLLIQLQDVSYCGGAGFLGNVCEG